MYGYGAYRSTEETPSLADCLSRARADIQDQYILRAVPANPDVKFASEWNALCDYIGKGEGNATELDDNAELLRLSALIPEIYVLLRVPMALWIEAQLSYDHGSHDRAWAALVRCNYYLGMCSGHETAKECSARGGRHAAERTHRLRQFVIEMLSAMSDKSRATKQDVWHEILPKMVAFKPPVTIEDEREAFRKRLDRSPIEIHRASLDRRGSIGKSASGTSTNPEQLLKRWTNRDAQIKQEFVRIVKGDLNTRAKRAKSAPKSDAPTKKSRGGR
jgi:hypothetical protein